MTDRNTALGYAAGIAAGVSYGMNPLFAKHLLGEGISVSTILFLRYAIAAVMMYGWILFRKERVAVSWKEAGWLVLLGLLFGTSSLTLFNSYLYIPTGLATTLIYLYPVFVALTMVFLKEYPDLKTWVAIFSTFAGVALLSVPGGMVNLRWEGIALATIGALVYAWYLVIVYSTKAVRNVSNHVLTFYALLVGAVGFASIQLCSGRRLLPASVDGLDLLCIFGLAVVTTQLSLLTLAISTRLIGATKTSVLGVFEPLTAIMIGTVIFGEPFTPRIAVGIAICIAAILFMVLFPTRGHGSK